MLANQWLASSTFLFSVICDFTCLPTKGSGCRYAEPYGSEVSAIGGSWTATFPKRMILWERIWFATHGKKAASFNTFPNRLLLGRVDDATSLLAVAFFPYVLIRLRPGA